MSTKQGIEYPFSKVYVDLFVNKIDMNIEVIDSFLYNLFSIKVTVTCM